MCLGWFNRRFRLWCFRFFSLRYPCRWLRADRNKSRGDEQHTSRILNQPVVNIGRLFNNQHESNRTPTSVPSLCKSPQHKYTMRNIIWCMPKNVVSTVLLCHAKSEGTEFCTGSSWIPHIDSRIGSSRRLRKMCPEVLRTCSMSSCKRVKGVYWSIFSARCMVEVCFGNIWASRDPKFPAKKNPQKTCRWRVDRGSQNTCAKIQDLSLKHIVNLPAFPRKTCVICVAAL